MTISENQIAVSKCYVTLQGQVRKVLSIEDGYVKYESRGKTDQGSASLSHVTVGALKFANDVDREVTCDWDPNYPERNP